MLVGKVADTSSAEPMMTTRLYMMRHGEVHNPDAILYGRMPGYFLSERGIAQVEAAGEWLADKGIAAIYCSPMERARQSAEIVAARLDGPGPKVDQRLIEVYTPYEGQKTAKLAAKGWDLYTGNLPPYELPTGVLERVLDFFDDMLSRHAGEAALAVAHGDILVFPWLHAQGAVPDALMKDHLPDYGLPVDYPATASIISFEMEISPRLAAPRVRYDCPY